jgi:hypothetical protein
MAATKLVVFYHGAYKTVKIIMVPITDKVNWLRELQEKVDEVVKKAFKELGV